MGMLLLPLADKNTRYVLISKIKDSSFKGCLCVVFFALEGAQMIILAGPAPASLVFNKMR